MGTDQGGAEGAGGAAGSCAARDPSEGQVWCRFGTTSTSIALRALSHNDSVVDDQDTNGNHLLTRQAQDLQLFSNHFLGKRFHQILVCPGFECLSHL